MLWTCRSRILDQRRFTFSAAIADHFRSGDAFLIGDAAHRVTAARRYRHEQRHSRRVQPRLEAVVGAQRLGAGFAARHLRGGTASKSLNTISPVHWIPWAAAASMRDEVRFDLGGRVPHVWIRHRGRPRLQPGSSRSGAQPLERGSSRRCSLDDHSNVPPVTQHVISIEGLQLS